MGSRMISGICNDPSTILDSLVYVRQEDTVFLDDKWAFFLLTFPVF